MSQHQVIVIWPAGKPSHRRVHIDFRPEKHAITAGNLCDKKSGRPLGIIQRVYTDTPKTEQLALSMSASNQQP